MSYKIAITGIFCLIIASAGFCQSSTAELAREQERERQRRQRDMEANNRYQQNQTKNTPGSYSNKYSALAEKERAVDEKNNLIRAGKFYKVFDETSTEINENGLRRVRVKNKYGFIDSKNVIRIGVLYDFAAESFYKGLVSVKMGNQTGYLDEYGRLIISYSVGGNKAYEKPESFDTRGAFSMHLAVVSKNNRFGFINESDEIIIPLVYDYASAFTEGLAVVKIGNKHGYIDPNGRVIIPVIYDVASVFYKDLAEVGMGNKYGYIDKSGKVIIPLIYERAGLGFFDGVANMKLNGKWGLINIQNKIIAPFIYELVLSMSEGLAGARLNGKWGFINAKGQVVIPLKFTNTVFFQDGLGLAQLGNKWGYINRKGMQVIPIIYDEAANFINGKVEFKLKGKSSCFDRLGKKIPVQSQVAEKKTTGVKSQEAARKTVNPVAAVKQPAVGIIKTKESYYEGLAIVQVFNKWGYKDLAGNVVIAAEYEDVWFFQKGVAAVQLNGLWGYIDKKGKMIVPNMYLEPGYLEIKADLLRGKTNTGYGVINFRGETIVPFIYDLISSILGSDKLISVQLNGKWGCLGQRGDVVIPVIYDKSLYFWKGYSAISLNNKVGIINEKGEIIVPVIYDEVKQQESFFMCKKNNVWLKIPAPISK